MKRSERQLWELATELAIGGSCVPDPDLQRRVGARDACGNDCYETKTATAAEAATTRKKRKIDATIAIKNSPTIRSSAEDRKGLQATRKKRRNRMAASAFSRRMANNAEQNQGPDKQLNPKSQPEFPIGTKVMANYGSHGWCTGKLISQDERYSQIQYYRGENSSFQVFQERYVPNDEIKDLVKTYQRYKERKVLKKRGEYVPRGNIFDPSQREPTMKPMWWWPQEEQLSQEEKTTLKSLEANMYVVPDGIVSSESSPTATAGPCSHDDAEVPEVVASSVTAATVSDGGSAQVNAADSVDEYSVSSTKENNTATNEPFRVEIVTANSKSGEESDTVNVSPNINEQRGLAYSAVTADDMATNDKAPLGPLLKLCKENRATVRANLETLRKTRDRAKALLKSGRQ